MPQGRSDLFQQHNLRRRAGEAPPAVLARQRCEPDGFASIDAANSAESMVSYLRRGRGQEPIVVVCNFKPVVREDYRVGVPRPGWYRERINPDALDYAGSGVGSAGGVRAESHPTHGHAHSIHWRLPPLGALIFSVGP
jgi:1,4-alpha-glucan branching enzyme